MTDDTEESSEFIKHIPCDECGSSDANSLYSDGHTHCFSCGAFVPGEGDVPESDRPKRVSGDLIPMGEYSALKSRGITEETCRHFGYTLGSLRGQKCHIAAYRDRDGDIAAQHIRLKGKEFPWVGKTKGLQLFGQHKARDGAPKIIITEGEIDAMSVHQIVNSGKSSRWACMSIGRGAKGAVKDIADNLPFLEKAEEVILMFDNDEPGIEAARECARVFRPGKCKIATLPLKDANDMLRARRNAEVIDAIFGAKEYRPEGIVSLSDIRQKVLTIPTMGTPWWLDAMNEDNYGRQLGELVGLGAGTGVGKTDFLTQQIAFDITTLNLKVGIFFLEQQPHESAQRLAGKLKGQTFHIPPDKCAKPWQMADLEAALDELDANDNLRLYDHFGVADYEPIEDAIRHLYHAEGVQYFYLDHLTALAAQAENEKVALENIMSRLGGLVKEIPVWICFVSHLTTPEGKPHEEGGRVMVRHFKGSRSIGYWSHRMYGLERNPHAEAEAERTTTTLRCLKDRPVGSATGRTYALGYDNNTSLLFGKSFEDDGWDADDEYSDPENDGDGGRPAF